jgi:DNA-nicking Smr family endonuclease
MSSITLTVPNHLHKYIIGTSGATLKNIQSSSGDPSLKIQLEGDKVILTSSNASALNNAKQQIEKIHAEHGQKVDLTKLTHVKEFKLPATLQKYVIGQGGAGIKQIQTATESQLTMNGDALTIKSVSPANADKAFKLVLGELRKYGWFYEEKTKNYVERNFTDQVFAKYREKANKEHDLMAQCFENSKTAFTSGRKDEAKKLSDEGKKHQENKDKYQKEAAQQIFKEMNKDAGEDTIDLHGLFVSEAVEFLEQRLANLSKSKKYTTLHVITGAGNHSAESAKIKPHISKLLSTKGLKYAVGNEGVFIVTL